MSEVIEQGATRRVRPSNSSQFGGYAPDTVRKDGVRRKPNPNRVPYQPKTRPMPNRKPDDVSPAEWRKWKRTGRPPAVPGHASPLLPNVGPDGSPRLPNARQPSRAPLRPLRTLGRAAGGGFGVGAFDAFESAFRFGRYVNPFGRLWDLADFLDTPGNIFPNPNPYTPPATGGWIRTCGPKGIERAYMYGRRSSSTQGDDCGLGGQALSSMQPWPPTVLATDRGLLRASRNNAPGAGGTFTIHEIWKRDVAGPTGQPGFQPYAIAAGVPMPDAPINANVMRNLPSLAPPVLEPGVLVVGVTVPATGRGLAAASAALVNAINAQAGSGVYGGLTGDGAAPIGVGVEIGKGGLRPVSPGHREPPKKNEKHGKLWSKTRLFAVLMFKALDEISESSEVVDALYEALPLATREKWNCKGGRGPIDGAGQYGIDHADCKAKALWHNFHKLNWSEAVENIIFNYVQDKIIGLMSRSAPVNSGRAFDGGMKLTNQQIESVYEKPIEMLVQGAWQASTPWKYPQVSSIRDAKIRDYIRNMLQQT